jgi:hypothetical protein
MYRMGKRYTVASVRERLAEALDQADKGVPVVIERRGVRYRLTVERPQKKAPSRRRPRITVVDPAVLSGEWTWDWTPDGLAFTATTPR